MPSAYRVWYKMYLPHLALTLLIHSFPSRRTHPPLYMKSYSLAAARHVIVGFHLEPLPRDLWAVGMFKKSNKRRENKCKECKGNGPVLFRANPKVPACSLEQVSNVNTVDANMLLSKYARCLLSAFLLASASSEEFYDPLLANKVP